MTPEPHGPFGLLAAARDAGAHVADEPTGKALLGTLGITVPEARVVGSADEAADAAAAVGWPVAVKVIALDLAHKSDVGGVEGPLHSVDEVRAAALRVGRPGATGVLVERWEDNGVACFVGLSLSSPFGAVVSFGLGGIWVELLRDVAHRLAPVNEQEAIEMIRAIRGAPVLCGARGRPPVALAPLASTIARISRLAIDERVTRLVAELDVNPLLVRASGAPVALDATVVLRPMSPRLATAKETDVLA